MKDIKGLTTKEVTERIEKGQVNISDIPKTKTIKQIIKDNLFTYFNFLNLALAIAVLTAGLINNNFFGSLKNCLFVGVIIVNTIISTIEEIISKKITDKLSIISETKVTVIRNGSEQIISYEDVVVDDIIKLTLGHQVVADSVIIDGIVEVNESFLTGEADNISKKKDDNILSGSFITSGTCYAKVTNVGKDCYVSKISKEAKYDKKINSVIMESFEKLLRVLSVLLIPIGIVMAFSQFAITKSAGDSIYATVAALIGMIPEGLVLLTSSVMAVGVIKLYRRHVLVQQLYAIEILARVDAICLDKTGTLTEGKMAIKSIIPYKKHKEDEVREYLNKYANQSSDTNSTMMCLKDYFKDGIKENIKEELNFSSDRKFGCLTFEKETLYLGAPDILGGKSILKEIEDYQTDYRVLAIAKGKKLSKNPENLEIIGFVLLEDVIRPSAKETLEFFKQNDVLVKIISGDDAKTVQSIAKKVGIEATAKDIGDLSKEEIQKLVKTIDIFGRVKPEQKKWIIEELQREGHTVAMTGDGVNDVLALKQSDCAISVKSGTDAARNISQLILLNDDFNSLPNVVKEGRQIINNVERSGSLLLAKTMYTIFLIILSVVAMQRYFFVPIQLTLITSFTIGAPSFILALEPNNELVKGKFLLKIVARALPVSLTVLFNVLIVTGFANVFGLTYEVSSSIAVILTGITGLIYLHKICTPYTVIRGLLFYTMLFGFTFSVLFVHDFFNVVSFNLAMILIILVLAIDSLYMYNLFNYIVTHVFNKIDNTIKVEERI